jgi:hypothetical protein
MRSRAARCSGIVSADRAQRVTQTASKRGRAPPHVTRSVGPLTRPSMAADGHAFGGSTVHFLSHFTFDRALPRAHHSLAVNPQVVRCRGQLARRGDGRLYDQIWRL